MATTKPIRQVTKTITPAGSNLILLDDGISMGKATLGDSVAAVADGLITTAIDDLNLGTAAQSDAIDFATAAQGSLADSAVQPGDIGTAAAEDVGYFATAAQGATADTAVQPGDLATVATSGAYSDLSGTPPLGTASAVDTIDEDDMASDSATKVPTQQSVKAYADLALKKSDNLASVANSQTAFSNIADTSKFNQAATGSFFETDGTPARIHRVNDRLLLGDATDYDGSSSLVTGSGSWLWDIGATSHMGWIELNARVASVSSRGIGITGAVQQTLSGGNALGGVFYADNNRAAGTSTSDKGWGAYVEARQGSGAGNTAGIETDITKLGASSIGGLNPYSPFATGHAVALRLASGGDANINPTTYDAEAAVQVINNGAKFLAGIVFGDTALTRDGGATGRAHAMRMTYDTAIEWYEYTTSALALSIASQITSTAAKQELRFSDTGMALLNSSGGTLFEAKFVASAVNYFRLAPAATGNTPTLSAQGSDTNINIALSPKGTGRVVFGSFTSSGDVAITGSVEIRTSEGTIRKLAVIA